MRYKPGSNTKVVPSGLPATSAWSESYPAKSSGLTVRVSAAGKVGRVGVSTTSGSYIADSSPRWSMAVTVYV